MAGKMAKKTFSAEVSINRLREAEVSLSQGKTVAEICKAMGISDQTYLPLEEIKLFSVY